MSFLPDINQIRKYLYIEKTPTWKIRLFYTFGIATWIPIVWNIFSSSSFDPVYVWVLRPAMLFIALYQFATFFSYLFYKQFDIKKHQNLVKSYKPNPAVDIFLPICDESLEILENTWKHVSNINYNNKKVYVLDDSKDNAALHKKLAKRHRFAYIERPNKGEMKKSGNLEYAFERTKGDFIVIFDADFAPLPEFIKETLPYMSNPKVGIVQTPQYFEMTKRSLKASRIAYDAAFAEEIFYRYIQVARDRLDGTICCGSNAVYRRSSLKKVGGFYQVGHSEDLHTGFMLTQEGYKVLYVPVILAIGLCPGSEYTFFHQQHRWCAGSMNIMKSSWFWKSKVSIKTKFAYITGFLFYLSQPINIFLTLQLFWILFIYNNYVPIWSGLIYYPQIIFSVIFIFFFQIARFDIGYFEVIFSRTFAYTQAIWATLIGKSVTWISTHSKVGSISNAYVAVRRFVLIYVIVSFLLILIGFRTGDIHLFEYKYWSIQFWIFWNFYVADYVLYQLGKIARGKKVPTN